MLCQLSYAGRRAADCSGARSGSGELEIACLAPGRAGLQLLHPLELGVPRAPAAAVARAAAAATRCRCARPAPPAPRARRARRGARRARRPRLAAVDEVLPEDGDASSASKCSGESSASSFTSSGCATQAASAFALEPLARLEQLRGELGHGRASERRRFGASPASVSRGRLEPVGEQPQRVLALGRVLVRAAGPRGPGRSASCRSGVRSSSSRDAIDDVALRPAEPLPRSRPERRPGPGPAAA